MRARPPPKRAGSHDTDPRPPAVRMPGSRPTPNWVTPPPWRYACGVVGRMRPPSTGSCPCAAFARRRAFRLLERELQARVPGPRLRAGHRREDDCGHTWVMVGAVHFYADADDVAALLSHLRHGDDVSLHPWPLVSNPMIFLEPIDAEAEDKVMVQSREIGPPVVLRDGDPTFETNDRAGVFIRMNRARLKPSVRKGLLVDSNRSPVMLWLPGRRDDTTLRVSSIGSQADSMRAVSVEYERWVNRTTAWVRRRGTQVWGLDRSNVRPDLDIEWGPVSSIYALPGALRFLESGGLGRQTPLLPQDPCRVLQPDEVRRSRSPLSATSRVPRRCHNRPARGQATGRSCISVAQG